MAGDRHRGRARAGDRLAAARYITLVNDFDDETESCRSSPRPRGGRHRGTPAPRGPRCGLRPRAPQRGDPRGMCESRPHTIWRAEPCAAGPAVSWVRRSTTDASSTVRRRKSSASPDAWTHSAACTRSDLHPHHGAGNSREWEARTRGEHRGSDLRPPADRTGRSLSHPLSHQPRDSPRSMRPASSRSSSMTRTRRGPLRRDWEVATDRAARGAVRGSAITIPTAHEPRA